MKWQQDQHQQQGYFSGTATGFNDLFSFSPIQLENSQCSMVNMLAADSTTPNWTVFDDVNSVISRTYSCPPTLVAKAVSEAEYKDTDLAKINSSIEKESFKKRKADKPHNSTKVAPEMDNKDKRGSKDEESKSKVQSSMKDKTKKNETCSKENSKASNVKKPEYIHVRARRGQATDSHSLNERIRREKISERMKYLQDLVPGCNKVTGKAGTLDEIINYVQSLQRQVEFLSMKLAAMNPSLDFNIYDMFTKEMFPTCTPSYSTRGISSDMTSPSYLQFKSQQEMVSSCGLDTVKNLPELHGSIPETFLGSSSFNQILPPSSTWEGDFQNLYNMAFDQAIATPFSSQQFTGLVEARNLMEM